MRLRADGPATVKLRQELYDLFQEDVEVRLRQQGSSGVNGTLTELEKDFYGSALALDNVRTLCCFHSAPRPYVFRVQVERTAACT